MGDQTGTGRMLDKRDQKPGRLAEMLVEHFERILGPDVEVRSPERIRGRDSGRRREVDVTLRRRVGAADVLIAIECRDRRGPQDVRWIEELSGKAADVGANAMIAVSTSGFTEAAKKSAAAKRVILRDLTQISAHDVERWFVRTQLSLPEHQFLGAVVTTGDPALPHIAILKNAEEAWPLFRIRPAEELRVLQRLWAPALEAVLSVPECVARIPRNGSKIPIVVTITPECDGATVNTPDAVYPLVKVEVIIALWMEPVRPAGMAARQYADDIGVFAQISSWEYPFPGGVWSVQVTEAPIGEEKYLFKHEDVIPAAESRPKKKRRST